MPGPWLGSQDTALLPCLRDTSTRAKTPSLLPWIDSVGTILGTVKIQAKKDSFGTLCYLPQTTREKMVGERGFEPPTPGPELSQSKIQVLYLVSLRNQHTCDYRKLVPRATGFFEGVVASLQRATRVMVLAIGDRTRSHGRWCS
jgi:hypothetical protein